MKKVSTTTLTSKHKVIKKCTATFAAYALLEIIKHFSGAVAFNLCESWPAPLFIISPHWDHETGSKCWCTHENVLTETEEEIWDSRRNEVSKVSDWMVHLIPILKFAKKSFLLLVYMCSQPVFFIYIRVKYCPHTRNSVDLKSLVYGMSRASVLVQLQTVYKVQSWTV